MSDPSRKPSVAETLMILKCIKTSRFCAVMQCVCCGRATSHRLIMTILITFGIIICYTQRVCLSLALTEMTKPAQVKGESEDGKLSKTSNCPVPGNNTDRPVIDPIEGGKFDWDEGIQGYILMAFYVGYLLCNIPAGLMCDRFGAKWVVLGGCFISSLTTGLLPLVAIYCHWSFVVLLRVFTGLGQSPIYPGATQLMARWIPSTERSLVGGFVLASLSLGTVAGNIPSAYILEYFESWVWVYYTYAILGGVFCILFVIFVYSAPENHPFITDEEMDYLSSRIFKKKKHKVPFKAIISDIVVWACMINQFGNDYTLFTIISNFPKYLNDVLKFTSKESGLIVCIPQVAMFIASFIFGAFTDAMVVHCNVPVVNMRIINTTISTILPCVCLLICCALRCDRLGAISAITVGMALKASFYSGMKVTLIDITQNHTGLVAAIVNACGGIAGAIAPYTIGKIAVDNTFEQWDLISWISLTIAVTSAIPYALFCRAERRLWDYTEDDEEAKPTEKRKLFSCVDPH